MTVLPTAPTAAAVDRGAAAASGPTELRRAWRALWDTPWRPVGRANLACTTLLVTAGSILHILRRPTALSEPQLLAEDGPILLLQTLQRGWRSFNDAYAGYLILVPRVLAWAVSPLPIRLTPVLYAWAATLLAVCVCALALSVRLSWLIASYPRRIALFLGLVVLPQIPEVHATLVNTVWWCGVGLLLLGLSTDPTSRAGQAAELVAVVAFVLSGAAGIITAPIAAHRLWRTRSLRSLVFVATWAAAAVTQLLILRSQDRPIGHVSGKITMLFGVALKRMFAPFAVGSSYLSDHTVSDVYRPAAWLSVVFIALLFTRVCALSTVRWTGPVLLGLAALGLLAGILVMGPQARYLPDRYATIPTVVVVIGVVASSPRHLLLRWLHGALVVWLLVVWPMSYAVPRRQPHDWTPAGRCLSSGEVPCTVPVLPGDLTFDVPPGGPRPG